MKGVEVGEFLVALREFAFTLERDSLFEGLGVFLLIFGRLLRCGDSCHQNKNYY